jgi:RimJ/RimL family protein N-acetyltransferase
MTEVRLRRWSPDDFPLLERGNEPAMTAYLGGPESAEELRARHARYLRLWTEGTARMFAIEDDGRPVGAIGWWRTRWRDADAAETGWFVLPEAQGRGVARAAVALIIDDARQHGPSGPLLAFPDVSNAASNALCRSAGFSPMGTQAFPFRGQVLDTNVWAINLALGSNA